MTHRILARVHWIAHRRGRVPGFLDGTDVAGKIVLYL